MAVVAPVPPFHPGYALGAEALFTVPVQLGGWGVCNVLHQLGDVMIL